MNILPAILIVLGLILFEVVSSVDNAVINAEVLSTMGQKAKRWFLFWGILFAVFVVRGALPWLIVWATSPALGPIGALTATFSGDPKVHAAIESASPLLLVSGGTFLILLFFHWLFLEPKKFGIKGEKFFYDQGIWFYAVAAIILAGIVWISIQINPIMSFGATIGSSVFFITHGFKKNAEEAEKKLMGSATSDWSKIIYLEIIDATFSIDGVLGAFAFTLAVPLILLGNGIGAFVVRQITVSNIERIQKYVYLKNGAMYSILILGLIMLLNSFGMKIPEYIAPLSTFGIICYFFYKSKLKISN